MTATDSLTWVIFRLPSTRAISPKISGIGSVKCSVATALLSKIGVEGLLPGINDGYVVDFSDAAARDAYLAHPDL